MNNISSIFITYYIGIISPLKAHRIAWSINQKRYTTLWRQKYENFQDSTHKDMKLFAHYAYQEGLNTYHLLYNKLELKNATTRPFIKEWSIFDYILLLQVDEVEKQTWIQDLSLISGIQYTLELDIRALKDHSWLIF